MNAKKTLIIALVGAYSLLLFCSGAWAWQRNINGTVSFNEWARAVAVDGAGNVVAAGFTQNTGYSTDFTVVKFDRASGTELWCQEIKVSTDGLDFSQEAHAVAVDSAGNVVAAGYTSYFDFELSYFMVVKFDGVSGVELWRKVINIGYDSANTVAVDAAGDVVAAGSTWNTDTGSDFIVVKFDG